MLLHEYITIFLVFSCLGWIWESIYCTAKQRHWANRDFLYGPLCPIYGCGGCLGLIVWRLAGAGTISELSWWQIFIAGFFVSMILEYPTSWILEKLFHARWWDYTNVPLNINGRTSVPTSVAFGDAAILVMKVLMPFFMKYIGMLSANALNIMALLTVAFLSADLTLTVSALTDFQRRIAYLDNTFQNHMTETVEHMSESVEHMSEAVERARNTQSRVYRRAAARISTIRLPERKSFSAGMLKENKLTDRLQELKTNRLTEFVREFRETKMGEFPKMPKKH